MDNIQKETELRKLIFNSLSEEITELFLHARLAQPLSEIISDAAVSGKNMHEMLGFVAEAANRQALSASGVINSVPGEKNKRAMQILMHAWVHLHEACIFGVHEDE